MNLNNFMDYFKKKRQVGKMIDNLKGAYDLPEHPNRMNGFKNKDEIVDKILAKFGINKPKSEV